MKRLYPDQPIVGVGAMIAEDGRILLEKRRNEPGKGKWSVPGGLVELGESVEETVLREVKEETGLSSVAHTHSLSSIQKGYMRLLCSWCIRGC